MAGSEVEIHISRPWRSKTMRDFISERIKGLPPSALWDFFDIMAATKDVISLGIGEPDFRTPRDISRAGMRCLEEGQTGYTSNKGLLELRQEVARHLDMIFGVSYDPEKEILITVGVSEALHIACSAIVNPGDEVIVSEPCFMAYEAGVILAGGVPVIVPARLENDFQITSKQIEEAVTERTKALIIGYPNNPTGAVMSRQGLEQIADVARRHDLFVISDEIYSRLVYGMEHTCFSSLPDARERTILLQGFSKSYAMTGWRLGYVAAPPEISDAMCKVHQYIIMTAPTMAQWAAIEALRNGEGAVREMVAEYDRRRRLMVKGLNDIGLPCFEPRGAFYAFPSIENSGMTSEEFSRKLLEEEKVAVIPGDTFGKNGEGFIRCSYVTSKENIEESLERMERFMKRHG